MANEWPAITLLVYCNSNPNPAVNGIEIYIYQYGTQANCWPSVLWMVL